MNVIIVSTVGLIYDGITSVIVSYLQAMDLTDLNVYVAGTIEVNPTIKRKIEKLGCRVINFPSRRVHTLSYAIALAKFIKKNHIQVMHAHGNSGTLAIEMAAAWLGGCKKRIAHSHNTQCDHIKVDKLLRPLFNLFYTDALACGEATGKWLFNEKVFTIIKNGRHVELFSYKPDIREKIRNEYAIGDSLAIGHVGGFVAQKNHKFLLKIYRSILEKEPSTKLFMVGDGILRPEIEEKAKKYGIKDRIIFTGNIDRVPDLLQGMDGMLLPSLFEGLPLVVVEWQMAGLPCLLADTITRECAVMDNVGFCALDAGSDVWAERMLKAATKNDRNKNASIAKMKMQRAGYDIKDSAAILKKIYMSN